jgi:hypothetical protein
MCKARQAAQSAKAKSKSKVGQRSSHCGQPRIEVLPPLDFGDCAAGETPQLPVTITNTGDADLILTLLTFSDSVFTQAGNAVSYGTTINPGGQVTMQVSFTPIVDGDKNATLTIGSNDYSPGRKDTVALKGRQVPPSIEIFRGNRILDVVPFATTDDAKRLDLPLPAPPGGDPGVTFPSKTLFDSNNNHPAVNDPSIFRVRIKHLPRGAANSIQATLKVLAQNNQPIMGRTSNIVIGGYGGKATSIGGMTVELRKNGAVWESPYLRVATTTATSGYGNSAIVHSPSPNYGDGVARDPIIGLQFGRKLKVSHTAAHGVIEKDFIMGGSPYAKVPVKFIVVGAASHPPNRLNENGHDKIAELNAYWAGHGLSFHLYAPPPPAPPAPPPPVIPITQLDPPYRNLIVIGEHTGNNPVANHAFSVEIDLSIKVAGITYTKAVDPQLAITAHIPLNSSPVQVGQVIKNAIDACTPGGALNGLRISAAVFCFPEPRIPLAPPVDYLANSPPKPLTPSIGIHGPIDIELKRLNGPNIEKLEIVGLRAINAAVPDTDVDIYCPQVSVPFIDSKMNPVSAAHRHWIRTFGPPHGDEYVSVVILPHQDSHNYDWLCEPGLCSLNDGSANWTDRIHANLRGQQSSSTPCSILNFNRWLSEECARFMIFIPELKFFEGLGNTLSHEFGHTLADCDHTTSEPEWFYDWELMHNAGPKRQTANTMTRHAIRVVSVRSNGPDWESYYIDCPNGYGKVARDRIAAKAAAWLAVNQSGFPWP